MKSIHYVASVVSAYRHAIDSYFENPEEFTIKQEWIDELNKVSHREYKVVSLIIKLLVMIKFIIQHLMNIHLIL